MSAFPDAMNPGSKNAPSDFRRLVLRGLRLIGLIVGWSSILLLAVANIALPVVEVPKFVQLFEDFGGRVPAITSFVISGRWALVAVACGLAAAWVIAIRRGRSGHVTSAITCLMLAQIVLTGAALIIPIFQMGGGVSGGPGG